MKEAKRKPYPSDLTDAQWKFIVPLLPPPAATGRPRADEREIINGILYVLTTGCSWEYLPHDIAATWQTCHRYLLDYQRRRVWQKIVRELIKLAYRRGRINLNNAYHDASAVKSKKGAKTREVFQENTVFTASKGTS